MDASERGILSTIELRSVGGRVRYYLIFAALVILALMTFFPIYFAFVGGIMGSTELYKPGFHLWPATPHWNNFYDSIIKYHLLRQFWNSIVIVSVGVVMQMTFSTLAAYSLARLKPIGGRYVMFGFLTTLMVPSIAYIIPLYKTIVNVPIINVSLINTYWGVWLPYSINAFAILVMKNFFEKLPNELFDAAKVEGASTLDIFFRFILPLSRSILAVLAILSFVGLWKDYMLPFLVLQQVPDMQPITVRLFTIAKFEPLNMQMAASFVAMLPPIIIAIFLQKIMMRGLSVGSVKG